MLERERERENFSIFFSRQHLVEDTFFFMGIGSNRRLINSSNYRRNDRATGQPLLLVLAPPFLFIRRGRCKSKVKRAERDTLTRT